MIQRLLLIAITVLLIACHDRQSPMEEGNSVYYWRTDALQYWASDEVHETYRKPYPDQKNILRQDE